MKPSLKAEACEAREETPHAGEAVLADGGVRKKTEFLAPSGVIAQAVIKDRLNAARELTRTGAPYFDTPGIEYAPSPARVFRTTQERVERIAKEAAETTGAAPGPPSALVMAQLENGTWTEVSLDSDGPVSPGKDLAIMRPMSMAPLALIMEEKTEPHFSILRMQMKEPKKFGVPHTERQSRVFRVIVKNTSSEPRVFRAWAIAKATA